MASLRQVWFVKECLRVCWRWRCLNCDNTFLSRLVNYIDEAIDRLIFQFTLDLSTTESLSFDLVSIFGITGRVVDGRDGVLPSRPGLNLPYKRVFTEARLAH